MAVDLGRITINGVLLISCDADPSIGIGLVASVGSIAFSSDGSGLYYKYNSLNTSWSLLSVNPSINLGQYTSK